MKPSLLLFCLFPIWLARADRASLGMYVEDAQSGAPLSGVKVIARFEDDIGWRAWAEEAKLDVKKGITDLRGMCRLSGKTNCGKSSIWIDSAPVGYYGASQGGRLSYSAKSLFGTWQPEDVVVTVALQRVENPIPLYVRYVKLRDDTGRVGGGDGTNAVLHFDFLVGDWLPPNGRGKQADMTIRTQYVTREVLTNGRESKVFYDFINEISFLGHGNGIYSESFAGKNLGIKFRKAPLAGYVSQKKMSFGYRKHKVGPNIFGKYYTDSNADCCHCFRIRSKFDENGKLIEACYGKIYGDINFEGWQNAGYKEIKFLYYLNPKSLDRNLEWDMKTNLCTDPGCLVRLDP